MPQNQESFTERMKKQSLAFWGGLCIFAGMFSGMAMNLIVDTSEMRRAEAQATRMGSAVGTGLFVLIGIVLIVLHFVRGKAK